MTITQSGAESTIALMVIVQRIVNTRNQLQPYFRMKRKYGFCAVDVGVYIR